MTTYCAACNEPIEGPLERDADGYPYHVARGCWLPMDDGGGVACGGCGSDDVSPVFGRDDKVECSECGGMNMRSPFGDGWHFLPAKAVRAARAAESMVRDAFGEER
jgi:hypothetical protein